MKEIKPMDFINYTNAWAQSEVYQARVMIVVGILFAIAFFGIIRSDNVFLKGILIPMGLMLLILLGYGSYMIYSRPAHAKEITALYQKSSDLAIQKEIEKHEKDNTTGKLLIHIYPILMLLSVIALIFASAPYYKGMAVGFILLFVSMFLIDNGFVARSDAFLSFLKL